MEKLLNAKKPILSAKEKKLRDIKLAKKIIYNVLFYAACLFITFWMIMPFYWSILSSLRPTAEIDALHISWFPSAFVWEHYATVFEEVDFWRMLSNSVIASVVGLATNLTFGTIAAYSFAKLRFKGHKIIFNIMMISMMIPGVITLVPTFLVISRFPLVGGNNILGQGGAGFYDTLWAVILPGAIGVYGIFFMRQFFVTLPDDMAESARIDGAGELLIFYRIYLPLVLPGLVTLGIFTFQGGWNNYLWPSIVLQSSDTKMLTQAFSQFRSSYVTKYGPLMALSTLMALPTIILFITAQKYFIKGVAVGGVKG